jgi:hypothetical protein
VKFFEVFESDTMKLAPVSQLLVEFAHRLRFASLTEARAPSLLRVEVKVALVRFIGPRPQHCAEDAAGVIAN